MLEMSDGKMYKTEKGIKQKKAEIRRREKQTNKTIGYRDAMKAGANYASHSRL